MNKSFSVKQITKIGILGCLSAILLMINFPIYPFPNFYKIDISIIPLLICGFALGPLSGFICTTISTLINILIEGGSETAFIGEFANYIIALSFVLCSSIIYKRKHSKKGATLSLFVGIMMSSFLSIIVNYYILIPMYELFMKIPLNDIIILASKNIPFISNKLSLVLLCTFPFNAIKGLINSLITIIIYKRISPLIKDID